jgi:hypothetical protein
MESSVGQCHLLRISRELRHSIYDLVIDFDPPTDISWQYKGGFGKDGYITNIVKTSSTKFSIPWVELLSTCKAINMEMIAYLDVRSNVGKEEHHTWTLQLATFGGFLKPSLWRQIPCPPAQARILVAKIDFTEKNAKFWGSGGPMPIVRFLYQTLNRILHYGPAFGRQVPLAEPLRLKTLVLRAKIGSSGASKEYVDTHPDPLWQF